MIYEPRTVMEGAPLPPQSSPPSSPPLPEPLASTSSSQEGIIGTEERATSSEPAHPTMTSSSSMELDLSERERVAELARLDKDSLDDLQSMVLGVASKRGVTLRGEEPLLSANHADNASPEWSISDEAAQDEDEERDEERFARPPFGESDVCLSDAETLGSNGSDELTDYENSGAIEHQRNGSDELTDYENSG